MCGIFVHEVPQEFHRERKAVSEKLLEATELALPILQAIIADDAAADLNPEAVEQLLGPRYLPEPCAPGIGPGGADPPDRPPRVAQGGHHVRDGPQPLEPQLAIRTQSRA